MLLFKYYQTIFISLMMGGACLYLLVSIYLEIVCKIHNVRFETTNTSSRLGDFSAHKKVMKETENIKLKRLIRVGLFLGKLSKICSWVGLIMFILFFLVILAFGLVIKN